MLNSSSQAFTYRHLIIKSPCLITYAFMKHCLPKHAGISTTFRGSSISSWVLARLMFCCLPLVHFFSLFQSRCLFNCFQNRDPRWLLSPFAFSWDFNEMEINPFGESVSFLVRGNRVITCGAAVQQRVMMDDYTHHPQDLFPCAVPSGNRRARTQQKLLVSGCKLISQWKNLRIGASSRQSDINGVGCETYINHHSSEYGKVGPLL